MDAHFCFQAFFFPCQFIHILTVSAQTQIQRRQIQIFIPQLVGQILLERRIRSGQLNKAIQVFPGKGPHAAVAQAEIGIRAKGNALHTGQHLASAEALPKRLRILQVLTHDPVAQIIHTAVGQDHSAAGHIEAQTGSDLIHALLNGGTGDGRFAELPILIPQISVIQKNRQQ